MPPRFKDALYDQTKLLAVSYDKQILPGTFEYALSVIIDEMDLSIFEGRYRNDEVGAPAYDPAILLKIILFAYSRGIVGSREIAQACVENVMFMALSADSHPHFTTIANFVSSLKVEIAVLFSTVVTLCSSEGLIGKNMFAVDGCKISSNCSKEWSGTRKDFEKKRAKLEKLIGRLLEKHRRRDELEVDDATVQKEKQALGRLRDKVNKIREWLKDNDDKRGPSGNVKQSNLTDNESAKMKTSHGVIQGHNGIALVDSQHQVVLHAEAHGEGQETALLIAFLDSAKQSVKKAGISENIFDGAKLVADAGNHSEDNLKQLEQREIDAYVADKNFRKRDPAFATRDRHRRSLDRKHTPVLRKNKYFTPRDFKLDEKTGKLICPAGTQLYVKRRNQYYRKTGVRGTLYNGWKTKCRGCKLRAKCIRGKRTEHRTVLITHVGVSAEHSYTKRMINKLDSPMGRYYYSRRLGIVEPVFAHLRHAIGLHRFTLRGKKTDIQWKLYTMVHNMRKLWRYSPGYAY
jgi:transposase